MTITTIAQIPSVLGLSFAALEPPAAQKGALMTLVATIVAVAVLAVSVLASLGFWWMSQRPA